MKYYLLLVYITAGLVALYYLTVLMHIFFGSFGKNVSTNKAFIPFYGWIMGLRDDKSKEPKPAETAKPEAENKRSAKKESAKRNKA